MKLKSSLPTYAGLLLGCTAFLTPHDDLLEPVAAATGRAETSGPPAHVVIVAIDGVRARDVFLGADPSRGAAVDTPAEVVPNLTRLAASGWGIGPGAMRASGPNFISLPGYAEILAGRPASCQRNDCDERPESTLIDALADAGFPPSRIGVVSSWGRIEAVAARAPNRAFTSCGRVHLEREAGLAPEVGEALRNGAVSAPYPGADDYRPDAQTMEVALAYMRAERPRFLFVSLGDTDEYAHAGDYDRYLASLRRADAFVGALHELLESFARDGEPHLMLVTTDHGRAEDFRDHGAEHPESSEVWLIGSGTGLTELPLSSRPRRLADIAPLVRAWEAQTE